jgi:hypothetical protein
MMATPVMTAKSSVTAPPPVSRIKQVNSRKDYQHHY